MWRQRALVGVGIAAVGAFAIYYHFLPQPAASGSSVPIEGAAEGAGSPAGAAVAPGVSGDPAVAIALGLDEVYEPADRRREPAPAEFQAISESQNFRGFMLDYHLKRSDVRLADGQRTALGDSLWLLCLAYHTGRFSDFEAFRMPAAHSYRSEILAWYRDWAGEQGVPAEQIPADPRAIWEMYWNRKNEGDEPYRGLWEAVTQPVVGVRSCDRMPLSLAEECEILDQPAVHPLPMVEFVRSPETVLQEEGRLLVADARLTIRHRGGMVYPHVCRMYWDSQSARWLPIDYLVLYVYERAADPPF